MIVASDQHTRKHRMKMSENLPRCISCYSSLAHTPNTIARYHSGLAPLYSASDLTNAQRITVDRYGDSSKMIVMRPTRLQVNAQALGAYIWKIPANQHTKYT